MRKQNVQAETVLFLPRPLNLGTLILIVPRAAHSVIMISVSMATNLFPVISYFSDFLLKNLNQAILPNIHIRLPDHSDEASSVKIKMERQRLLKEPFRIERSVTQYITMATKSLRLGCGTHLVEPCCRKPSISDTNWLYIFLQIWVKKKMSITYAASRVLLILRNWKKNSRLLTKLSPT